MCVVASRAVALRPLNLKHENKRLVIRLSYLRQARGDKRVGADDVELLRRGQTQPGNEEIGQKPAGLSWLRQPTGRR